MPNDSRDSEYLQKRVGNNDYVCINEVGVPDIFQTEIKKISCVQRLRLMCFSKRHLLGTTGYPPFCMFGFQVSGGDTVSGGNTVFCGYGKSI
jgi:hypothetical protein